MILYAKCRKCETYYSNTEENGELEAICPKCGCTGVETLEMSNGKPPAWYKNARAKQTFFQKLKEFIKF